jgi:hypothetical protein
MEDDDMFELLAIGAALILTWIIAGFLFIMLV